MKKMLTPILLAACIMAVAANAKASKATKGLAEAAAAQKDAEKKCKGSSCLGQCIDCVAMVGFDTAACPEAVADCIACRRPCEMKKKTKEKPQGTKPVAGALVQKEHSLSVRDAVVPKAAPEKDPGDAPPLPDTMTAKDVKIMQDYCRGEKKKNGVSATACVQAVLTKEEKLIVAMEGYDQSRCPEVKKWNCGEFKAADARNNCREEKLFCQDPQKYFGIHRKRVDICNYVLNLEHWSEQKDLWLKAHPGGAK